MARCPWEAGMEVDSNPSKKEEPVKAPARRPVEDKASYWSKDSGLYSDIEFAPRSAVEREKAEYEQEAWTGPSSRREWVYSWGTGTESNSNYAMARGDSHWTYASSSSSHRSPADSSVPATPNRISFVYPEGGAAVRTKGESRTQLRKPLFVDTHLFQSRHFDRRVSDYSYSPGSSMMQTALETPNPSSTYFMANPNPECGGDTVGIPDTIKLGPSIANTEEKTVYMSLEDADGLDSASGRWGYAPTEPPTSPGAFTSPPQSAEGRDDQSYVSPVTSSPDTGTPP